MINASANLWENTDRMGTKSWWVLWVLTYTIITVKGAAATQRCYICIPNIGLSVRDVLDLFPSGPVIPLCNQFQPGRKEFIRECPSEDDYLGCITETNGTHVTKTCTTTAVTDCNTANNITYCYCTGDLCNAEPVPDEEARPAVEASQESLQPPDDEDLSEGSGDYRSSSETLDSDSRLPTSQDDVTVEEPGKTSERPREQTTIKVRNGASSLSSSLLLTAFLLSGLRLLKASY